MTIISQISIDRTGGNSTIQLIHGDLSNIPPEHESDILIMPAFPNNYIALKGSLILALEQKGLSVKNACRNRPHRTIKLQA